jgi:arylsulfatase A-like enzyme
MIRHGFEVWDELVRVPLLVHVPGAEPRRITARRSLIDVAPTVLDALSVALPQEPNQSFQGRSLLPEVLAPPGATPEARPVLVDMPEGPHNRERRAYYDGDFKLITSAGRVLGLYNLAEDPGEKKDLSADAALVSRIQGAMDDFLDRLVPARPTR